MVLNYDKCCCCVDLRIGCFLIGYFGVFENIFVVVATAVCTNIGCQLEENKTVKISLAFACPYIFLTLVCGALNVLLLVGVHKRKPAFLNAAWITMIVYNILDAIIILAKFKKKAFLTIVVRICMHIYCDLCIRSYYLELKNEYDDEDVKDEYEEVLNFYKKKKLC